MSADTTPPAAVQVRYAHLPARPGGDAYWDLVQKHVDAAPPLSTEVRAALRVAIHGCSSTRTEAA